MVNAAMFVVGITSAPQEMGVFFGSVILSMVGSYFVMLLMGLMPLVTEWKRIYCSRAKKIGYLFTFPLFVATFSLAMAVSYTHLVRASSTFCSTVWWGIRL